MYILLYLSRSYCLPLFLQLSPITWSSCTYDLHTFKLDLTTTSRLTKMVRDAGKLEDRSVQPPSWPPPDALCSVMLGVMRRIWHQVLVAALSGITAHPEVAR